MDIKTLNATINAVCIHVMNFFVLPTQKHTGKIRLENGMIYLPLALKTGQRVWIEPSAGEHTEAYGSYKVTQAFDGYFQLEGLEDVSDEWTGTVWGCAVKKDFLDLCQRIAEWQAENPHTNVVSEKVANFHSVSYATAGGPKGGKGGGEPLGAYDIFRKELAAYRKMFTGVRY